MLADTTCNSLKYSCTYFGKSQRLFLFYHRSVWWMRTAGLLSWLVLSCRI